MHRQMQSSARSKKSHLDTARCNRAPGQFVVLSSRLRLKRITFFPHRVTKRGETSRCEQLLKNRLIVRLSVGRSRPPLSVCSRVSGRVWAKKKKTMARFWCPIVFIFASFLIIVHAQRHHHQSLLELIKNPEQIHVVDSMLRNYQGKRLSTPRSRHL